MQYKSQSEIWAVQAKEETEEEEDEEPKMKQKHTQKSSKKLPGKNISSQVIEN